MRVISRGTLAYAAVWHGDRLLTIELTERFELVVRDGPRLAEVARIELGPPEIDLSALAISGDVALVGGEDGFVRRIDLAARHEIDRWPQGAPITALAADAEHVVAGDAAGVICLRRSTGELLQCATRAATSITRVALDGSRVTVVTAERSEVLTVPSLARDAGPAARLTWHGGAVRWRARTVHWLGPQGPRKLATLGGPVRAVAASPRGSLVIAGWVKQLDQPSVVVWTRPPR